MLDYGGPFCPSKIAQQNIRHLIEKLKSFESMTWGEVLGRRDHAIAVDSLTKEAQERLREIDMDDVDELISLHFDGKKRLFGIRNGAVLNLLWWDPLHQVCKSVKKHT